MVWLPLCAPRRSALAGFCGCLLANSQSPHSFLHGFDCGCFVVVRSKLCSVGLCTSTISAAFQKSPRDLSEMVGLSARSTPAAIRSAKSVIHHIFLISSTWPVSENVARYRGTGEGGSGCRFRRLQPCVRGGSDITRRAYPPMRRRPRYCLSLDFARNRKRQGKRRCKCLLARS